jgi:hypothetical protein
MNWVNTRWLMGPDTFTGNAREDVRPPRFHAFRISRKMAEQRLLPVRIEHPITPAGNEVRAAATAADDGSGVYRMVAVNFNYRLGGGSRERVRVTLEGLPIDDEEVEFTAYRIDEDHNNWWKYWRAFREKEGIAYAHSDGVTHLGPMLEIDEKYLENHLYVRVTTDDEGYRRWLEKVPEFKKMDALKATSRGALAVRDGKAVIETDMAANCTMFWEVRAPRGELPPARLLPIEAWETGDGVSLSGNHLVFTPHENGRIAAELPVTDLEPNARYALVFTADSPVRLVDIECVLRPGLDAEVSRAWIDYDGVPQRLVLSGTAGPDGQIGLTIQAPPQPWEAKDQVRFRDFAIRRIDGAHPTGRGR